MTVVGRKELPPQSAAELLDYIRINKDEVTIGNAGVGGPSHLCGMLLMSRLDTPMTTVPCKGTGPAMTDLLGARSAGVPFVGRVADGEDDPFAAESVLTIGTMSELDALWDRLAVAPPPVP